MGHFYILKKKKLVRLVAMIMTMAMLLSTGIAQVFAEDTTETQVRNSQIVSALRQAENYKDELGLENVNFSAIAVANPIKTYTVISSGLQEDGFFRRIRGSYYVQS